MSRKTLQESGGHAFPTTDYYDDKPIGEDSGMTLRDYFAAKAMQAALTNEALLTRLGKRVACDLDAGHADLATGSYAMADAMLAERAK